MPKPVLHPQYSGTSEFHQCQHAMCLAIAPACPQASVARVRPAPSSRPGASADLTDVGSPALASSDVELLIYWHMWNSTSQ